MYATYVINDHDDMPYEFMYHPNLYSFHALMCSFYFITWSENGPYPMVCSQL